MSKVYQLFAPTMQHALAALSAGEQERDLPSGQVIHLDAYRDFHAPAQIADLETRIMQAGR